MSEDWRARITRPALVLDVGGFRPSGRPDAPRFGEVRLERPGEVWPTFRDRPLWPVCQLNLSEAAFRPAGLEDVALLAFFATGDVASMGSTDWIDASLSPDGYAWFVRAYPSLDGLVTTSPPDHGSPLRPFEARWRDVPELDYPTHDLLDQAGYDEDALGDYYDHEGVRTLDGTKLGGWPRCIQSEPWWDYRGRGTDVRYVLQIDTEEKANWFWGDAGCGYLARSPSRPSVWALDFQFT